MSKLSIILCALLFASVALADDMEEYNHSKLAFQLRMCLRSITKAGRELQQHYSAKAMTWEDYAAAMDSLNKLRSIAREAPSIEFLPPLTTYAGHVIFCNRDMAEKIREITHTAAGER